MFSTVNKVAEALRDAKARNKWTYREMAERSGTVATTVLNWTRGARPEPESWSAVAEMLGWDLSELEAELGYGSNQKAEGPSLSREEIELVSWYRDPELRDLFDAVVRTARKMAVREDRQIQEEGKPRKRGDRVQV